MKQHNSFEYQDVNINKHGGNEQSNKANVKVAPVKLNWREKILTLIIDRDAQSMPTSLLDACKYFSKERGQLSGRFTELKAQGLIEPTGVENSEGFMYYRIVGSVKVAKKI